MKAEGFIHSSNITDSIAQCEEGAQTREPDKAVGNTSKKNQSKARDKKELDLENMMPHERHWIQASTPAGGFHLCEMSRTGNSTETESGQVVARGWQEGRTGVSADGG